ncbi:MAG: hypothetical protein N4A72_00280 [Bacteroidales bacterium]|nr:hypothetical protein [Bacteroidales bacterium]
MKRILKRFFIYITVILVLLISTALTTAYIFKDEITQKALDKINSNVNTKISVSNVEFSLFKQFPHISIVLNNVSINSSDKTKEKLITAENIFLNLDSRKLLKGEVQISEIHIKNGKININIDRRGRSNYNIIKNKSNSTSKNDVIINYIIATNTEIKYYDARSKLLIKSKTKKTGVEITKESYKIVTDTYINNLISGNISLTNKHVMIKTLIIPQKDNITFKDNVIVFNKERILAQVVLKKIKKNWHSEIKAQSSNASIQRIINLAEELTNKKLKHSDIKGNIDWRFVYSGSIKRFNNFRIAFANSGTVDVNYNGTLLKLKHIEGIYSNNSNSVNVSKYNLSLRNSSVSGNFRYNTNTGSTYFKASGDVNADDIAPFLESDYREITNGEATLNVGANVIYNRKKISNIKIDKGSFIVLKNISLNTSALNHPITNLNGALRYNRESSIENLSFNINKSDFTLNGRIRNIIEYFKSDNYPLSIDANLKSENIIIDDIKKSDNNKTQDVEINLPDRVVFDFRLDVGQFRYKDISAHNIKGMFNYKPKMITLKSITMNSMHGKISGGGIVVQKYNGDFTLTSQCRLNRIDVKMLFRSFKDFNQKAISHKNIEGSFSGDIDFKSEWDKNLKHNQEKIISTINFNIENGALFDYEPVYKIGKYLKEKDLKRLDFESMNSTITISNSNIHLPDMEIKSSSADITVSGDHNFNNNFDYRLKLRLSDLIIGKKKLKKRRDTEFGKIKDDGAGHTSIFLKIIGNPSDYKIQYDTRGAGRKMKETFKRQGSELRDAFRKEFGKKKKDSTKTKKKKFELEWDDD